ncbi:translocation/assembly module TamB domain-containing protein [Microvirga pudoricolor]|uniref:translocation/assembly module TamB domain-containing protein n=1 Tax=Microvirga pudoricolor TaxID=2778729 RepID=UPI001951CAD9|nr:translocation/assembly module TamB domain-containing protein [Microvirga pudoricolor]MBM6594851.1 translocation/assembly module TamB domain-containing protein [Microvirga pudoricolor]
MSNMRRLLLTVATLALAGALMLAIAPATRSDEADKSFLADLISRALSTPATRVSVGAVEGALSSNSTIRDVSISDRDGVWLRVDTVRLEWSRLALLSRRLEVNKLEIGRLEFLREPLPSEVEVQGADQPILPELPVKVEIQDFALRELVLGEPVIGTAARLTATGNASLGAPAEGLRLVFDARRLDAPGTLAARLNYNASALTLALNVDEPANGILARAGNIPGLPPVKLDLNGNGTLDAFGAQLTFTAGPTIGAAGQAQLARQGAARRLNLNLDARIEGLLPQIVAPVFAGTTRLEGNTLFGDDGSVSLQQLALVSQAARLDISGNLSPDRNADFRVSARAVPNSSGNSTVAGAAQIKTLVFDGTVQGQITAPRIAATLTAEDARLPALSLANVNATFTATPNGSLSEPATRIALVADGRASGVSFADPALARAFGNQLTMALRGSATPEGVIDIETTRVATSTVNATYTGRLGARDATGRLALNAPDLTRFGDLAGLSLQGVLDLDANVQGLLSDGPITANLNGQATRFGTGIPTVDGLVGGRLNLSGTARTLLGGGFGFQNLALSGEHVTATLNGDARSDSLALNANLTVPQLRFADSRLTGRGEVAAGLTGTFARPNATFRAALSNATALGRPISQLTLDGTGNDLLGLPDIRATLAGDVDRKSANGVFHVAKRQEGGWLVDQLNVAIGSVNVTGNLTLDAANLAGGRLTVRAGNLDDLSPLVLTRLSGDLNADLQLEVVNGGQNATLQASGNRLRAAEASIDRLNARAGATDVYRRPVINADVTVDRALVAGETISQIRLTANGTTAASDIALTAQARGFDLSARGRLLPENNIRFELASFRARRGSREIALVQPANLALLNGDLDIRGLTVAVGTGRIDVNGRAGSQLDLQANVRAVPLSAAEIFVPGLGLTGTLDGQARIAGTSAAPTGDWQFRVARLVAPQTANAGLPPVDISANGRLDGGRTTLNGTVNAGRAGTFRLSGSVPVGGTGNLDLTAQGRLDLSIANTVLGAAGRSVTGAANLDLRVGGTIANPDVDGTATLSGGSFDDAGQGIRLTNIQARLVADGTNVRVERLSASTPNGGTLAVAGRVSIDPTAGFPGDIRITGQRAQLVSNPLVTTVANLALQLTGPLASDPRISGRVEILSMDVAVPERLPSTLRPIPGTKHVRPTPTAAARLALARQAAARARTAPPFNATLDLVVSAPSQIFVRGRGIDAELGGELQLTGSLANPVAVGAFDLRRGRLQVIGTRLDFTRGRLTFTGDLTPELDFIAESQSGDVTAYVAITGVATEPTFTFSSSPALPQDEVLSRILFGKASGGLSATQALQLAQAAAQFAGGGNDGVFENLRRSLGLSDLDISVGADGGPTVGISRAISDRVSVGVRAGASAEDTGVTVNIDVTRRIRIQGEVGAEGNTSVGVATEWEY